MSESVKISVVVLDGDTEISTMNMLVQVIDHMTMMQGLTFSERHRIADWFASRYSNKEPA